MSANLFDVQYYRQKNPDLAAAGVISDQQLTDHFFGSGLNEGRTFSRFVDLNYYRASYSDLSVQNLPDNRALYNHLSNDGIREGRRFSRFADIGFYRQASRDLAVSGLDNERLFDHLQTFGFNEGRRFSPFFDLGFYKQASADLTALNFDRSQLFEHLRDYGLDEPGRRFSQFFDPNFYNTVNPDLAAAGVNSPRKLFEHFVDNGARENRTASPFASVNFYRFANGDLAPALSDNLEAYRSLQTAGLDQGRRISPFVDLNLYRQVNPDLYAINPSPYDLLNHLQVYGLGEDRRICNSFDPRTYRANNGDLASFGGRDLLNHFAIYGVNETSRGASSDIFNLNFYRTNNPDLNAAGVNTNLAALQHYEAYGYKENRRASNTPLSLSSNPGATLAAASNLGFLSSDRRGTLPAQQLGANAGQQVYRFNTGAVTTLNVSFASFTGNLDLEVIFDANANGQIDTGEVIQTTPITQATRGVNLTLGAGTYFTRLTNRAAGVNNYRVSFTPTANSGITTIDPGNTVDGTFALGNRNTAVIANDFIGTADRNDYYYFTTDSSSLQVAVSGYNAELRLTVVEDLNKNRVIDAGDRTRTRLATGPTGQLISVLSFDYFDPGNYFVLVSTDKANVNTIYRLSLNIDDL